MTAKILKNIDKFGFSTYQEAVQSHKIAEENSQDNLCAFMRCFIVGEKNIRNCLVMSSVSYLCQVKLPM